MRKLIALVGFVAGSVAAQQPTPTVPLPSSVVQPCGSSAPVPITVRSRVEAPPPVDGNTPGMVAVTGWLIYRRRVPNTEWETPPTDQQGTADVGAVVEHPLQLDPTGDWEVAVVAYGPAGPSDFSNILRIPASSSLCIRPGTPTLLDFQVLPATAN